MNFSNKIHALPLICCIFVDFEYADSLFSDFSIFSKTFYYLNNHG